MRYYIGMGGNLGDVAATMTAALRELGERGARVARLSSLYTTAPMGERAGERYINAVAAVDSSRSPAELLAACHEVEAACGRVRGIPWGPRTLDLDLLLAESFSLETAALTIPHPGIPYRRFVLDPLCEIAAEVVHPLLEATIEEIRNWLLPRPLDVFVRPRDGRPASDFERALSPELRSRVQIREMANGELPADGWLVDCVAPADPRRPRFLSLADANDPVVRFGEILEAMTDAPEVIL